MTQHTPAPWRYSADETGAPIVGPDNVRICDMDCVDYYEIVDDADTGEGAAAVAEYEARQEANAKLVAAAPELLDALRKIANCPASDVLLYIQEVDTIACETLARLDFSL